MGTAGEKSEGAVAMETILGGPDGDRRARGVAALNAVIADAYVLLVKTRKAHWDLAGARFHALRARWDEQYDALAEAIDALAARVRALGGEPVATMEGPVTEDALREEVGRVLNDALSVESLLADHDAMIRALERCDDAGDGEAAALLRRLIRERARDARRLRGFVDDVARVEARRAEPSYELAAP